MIYRVSSGVAVLLLAIFCGSCADNGKRYQPVHTDQPRISTLGFSVQPPQGPNWLEKVGRDSLFYYKHTPATTYSIAGRATELRFRREFDGTADFLAYVKNQKEITALAPIRNVHLSFDKGGPAEHCVRYRQSYEDHRPGALSGLAGAPFAMITNTGLICIHPADAQVGIDLFYQERQTPGNPARLFAEEGEFFLDSLSFLTLTKKP